MNFVRRTSPLSAFTVLLGLMNGAVAQQNPPPPAAPTEDETVEYEINVLQDGLSEPCGLAIRPSKEAEAAELYLAEAGARRIVRIDPDDPDTLAEVLEIEKSSLTQQSAPFPLSPLLFLSRTKLAVGYAGTVQVYDFPASATPPKNLEIDYSIGPLKGLNDTTASKLRFLDFAASEFDLYITTWSEDSTLRILKSGIVGRELEHLQTFWTGSTAEENFTGVVIHPRPDLPFVVVASSGELQGETDSELAYFHPVEGIELLRLNVGLRDIIDIAYSPSGQLYAADFATGSSEAGGIFRVEDARVEGRPSCRAVKIATLPYPTSLAFDAEGNLYVTTLGEEKNRRQGQLIKITGQF